MSATKQKPSEKCLYCGGTGLVTQWGAGDNMDVYQDACDECGGTGELHEQKEKER